MMTQGPGDRFMISRLVLVGVVAALGITVPSRPECEQWMNTVGAWANATLAGWDTWTPPDADAYCLAESPREAECAHCRRARASLVAKKRADAQVVKNAPKAPALTAPNSGGARAGVDSRLDRA